MAFSENFDSGSGELNTSGSWTKVGTDPAAVLLDFFDNGLGSSSDSGSGDCGYVHTGQGTAARVEARLRKLSSASPILCPKLTDENNYGGLRVVGTGSIGTRLVIVDAGVQDDTGIRFQGVVDTWYAVEQDGAGGWEIEEGGTGGTPTWSSVGTHTDAAHDAETVQGFMSPSNTGATFGASAAWWDDYSADSIGAAALDVSGGVSSQASTTQGEVDLTIDAQGDVQADASTSAGSAGLVADVSGGVQADASTASGNVSQDGTVSGDVSAQGASVGGSIDAIAGVSGSVASNESSASGAVDVSMSVQGAVSAQESVSAGSAGVVLDVSGSVQAGASATAGVVREPGSVIRPSAPFRATPALYPAPYPYGPTKSKGS